MMRTAFFSHERTTSEPPRRVTHWKMPTHGLKLFDGDLISLG